MRDEFRLLPKDTDVSVGEDTILKCAPPKGHPMPEVRWKKDGDYLDLTSSNRLVNDLKLLKNTLNIIAALLTGLELMNRETW